MAAKKKAADDAAAAPQAQPMAQAPMMQPGMQPAMPQQFAQPGMQPGMPQQFAQPGMQPGMPQQFAQPGMPQQFAQPGMPQQFAQPGVPQQFAQQPQQFAQPYPPQFAPNPYAMMQMFGQMMGGFGGGFAGIDPSAMPFATPVSAAPDGDPGLDAQIIKPALLENRIKTQQALKLGNILDFLCLTEDGKNALGGVPAGCTMVFVGPPGQGKTRTALASLARVALSGKKCAFTVAEEGFHDDEGTGRDDLCSRMVKVGMAATGLDEKTFAEKVLANMFVLEAQYHKSVSWDDFIKKYRYLVEKEGIEFVVIDSLNMIDPTKKGTADNLSALKTYNHEQGVTCICIGQIKDTGEPVGGEALQHTADVVFLLEEMGLSSKEIAEFWGGKYRDKIAVLHIIKSVTTPTLQYPVRVDRKPGTGELMVHDLQPKDYPLLPTK